MTKNGQQLDVAMFLIVCTVNPRYKDNIFVPKDGAIKRTFLLYRVHND